MDAATSIYNSLNSEADIHALAASTPEKTHLEFKERSQPNKPLAEDKGTRADVAEALSGFANSAGGVLVIGVDDKTGALKPMSDLAMAEKQLHRELSTATYPPVIGATAKRIPTALGPDAGYLVLLVPQSDEGPHQTQTKGKKLYYMRAGESFVQMHHTDLELRFGRPPRPVLRLQGRFRQESNISRIEAVLCLKNEGRGVARDPMLALLRSTCTIEGIRPLARDAHFVVPEHRSGPPAPMEFWSRSRVCVYPDHALECFHFTISPTRIPHWWTDEPVVHIEARLFAENMRPVRRRVVFTAVHHRKLGYDPLLVDDEAI